MFTPIWSTGPPRSRRSNELHKRTLIALIATVSGGIKRRCTARIRPANLGLGCWPASKDIVKKRLTPPMCDQLGRSVASSPCRPGKESPGRLQARPTVSDRACRFASLACGPYVARPTRPHVGTNGSGGGRSAARLAAQIMSDPHAWSTSGPRARPLRPEAKSRSDCSVQ